MSTMLFYLQCFSSQKGKKDDSQHVFWLNLIRSYFIS